MLDLPGRPGPQRNFFELTVQLHYAQGARHLPDAVAHVATAARVGAQRASAACMWHSGASDRPHCSVCQPSGSGRLQVIPHPCMFVPALTALSCQHRASTACRFCGQGNWESTFGKLPRAQPTVKVLQLPIMFPLSEWHSYRAKLEMHCTASLAHVVHGRVCRAASQCCLQVEFGNRSSALVSMAPGARGMRDFQVPCMTLLAQLLSAFMTPASSYGYQCAQVLM